MSYPEKPLKVHLYMHQGGATYKSCGHERPYADTACKHNWPVKHVTTDPTKVTCKSCLKAMRAGRVPLYERPAPPPSLKAVPGDIVEYFASRLVRVAQEMNNRASREDVILGNEEHAFDLEAMDQYAAKVRAVAEMLRMETAFNLSIKPITEK